MFRNLGEKKFDFRYWYRCLLLWILVYFCTVYVCFILFPIDVTAIKRCGVTWLVCRTFDHHNNDYITTLSHWWSTTGRLSRTSSHALLMWTTSYAAYWMHAAEWLLHISILTLLILRCSVQLQYCRCSMFDVRISLTLLFSFVNRQQTRLWGLQTIKLLMTFTMH